MERILKYDKTFMLIHTYIIGLYLFYAFLYLFSGHISEISIQGILFLSFGYLLNVVFSKFLYFNKPFIFIFIRFYYLITLAFLTFMDVSFISKTAPMFFLVIGIELILCISFNQVISRWILQLCSIIPFVFCALIVLKQEVYAIDTFFYLIQTVIIILSVYKLLTEYSKDLYVQIEEKTHLLRQSELNNEDLRLSQNKFKKMHDDISKQKFELEEYNNRLNRMTAEMYTQNELLRYITSVLDIEELMDLVTDAIIGTIGVDTCSIIIYEQRSKHHYYKVKSNYPGDYKSKIRLATKEGLLDEYFKKGSTHLDNHVHKERYPFIDNRPVGSILIIPLIRDGITYGLMIAEHTTFDMFTDSNVQFFKGITTQINIAVDNANLYAKMEDMAKKDGLTGIYNRKYLQERLVSLVEYSRKYALPISVALFDIDKFKKVNDTYGHLFGDEAIKMVAEKAHKQAKIHNGISARYGGEEFVLVLPGISMDDGYKIVQTMHEEIIAESLYFNKTEEVHINVSIGITTFPDICKNAEELLLRADNAMYISKNMGRGRITRDQENLQSEE